MKKHRKKKASPTSIVHVSSPKTNEQTQHHHHGHSHGHHQSQQIGSGSRKSRWNRKSKWIRRSTCIQMRNMSTLSSKQTGSTLTPGKPKLYNQSSEEFKTIDAEHFGVCPEEYDDDSFVPYFRRNIRHFASPIKIAPLNNGQQYSVRIKAVTLSGVKTTTFSNQQIPRGPPPMPKNCNCETKNIICGNYI